MTLSLPTIEIVSHSPYKVVAKALDLSQDITTIIWEFSNDQNFTNIIETINNTDSFTYVFPSNYINVNLFLRLKVSNSIDESDWQIQELSSFPLLTAPTLEFLKSDPQKIPVLATNIDPATSLVTFQVSITDSPNTWDNANILQTFNNTSILWNYRVPYEDRNNFAEGNKIHYFRAKVSAIADFDYITGAELYLDSPWSSTYTSIPQQLQDKDFESNSVTTGAIKPGSIGTGELKPQIVVGTGGLTLLGALDPKDINSNTINITTEGLLFKDKDKNDLFKLPTDPSGTVFIHGNVNADSLYSSGATLVNTTSISNSSNIILSSGKLKDPLSPPTVTSIYNQSYFINDDSQVQMSPGGGGINTGLGAGSGTHWNLWVDQAGGSANNIKTAWMAIPYSANAAIEYQIFDNDPNYGFGFNSLAFRTLNVSGECHAVCRAGGASTIPSRIFAMFYRSATTMYINAYSTSNLSLVKQQFETVSCYEPTMLPDIGRNNTLIIIDADPNSLVNNAPTKLRFRSYPIDSTGKIGTPVTALTSGTLSGFATVDYTSICATMKDNNTIYISVADTVKEKVLKFTLGRNTSGYINSITPASSDTEWTAAWDAAPWGLVWDSTLNSGSGAFWVHDGGSLAWKSNTSGDENTYNFAYTFRDTGGTYSTLISPARTYKRIPYANVRIAPTQNLPASSGYTYGFYAQQTSPSLWSNYYLQGIDPAYKSIETLVNITAVAPSTNNFSGGTPATITLDSPNGLTISGNGNITRSNLIASSSNVNVVGTAISGTPTLNIDVLTASIWYYTTVAGSNSTINFRGSSSSTLSSLLITGQNMEVIFMNTNGTTAYKPTTFQIDGSTITPKWSGGAAPSANASSVDAYLFNIVRVASTNTVATDFVIFARQIRYA